LFQTDFIIESHMTEEKWEGFKKPNFGPPPTGYIAGYGRGATGFITRSDIGPAKMAENPFLKQREQDDANYNDAKYDEWSGYSAPLFSAQQLDDEDK
jgi:pre-mRNA-processing factor 6